MFRSVVPVSLYNCKYCKYLHCSVYCTIYSFQNFERYYWYFKRVSTL